MKYETVPILRGFETLEKINNFMLELGIKYMICGGFARYCLSPNASPSLASDIDVFLTEDKYDRVERYLAEKYIRVDWVTGNSIHFCLSNIDLPINIIGKEGSIFKVYTEYIDIQTILDKFDFTICMAAIVDDKNGIVVKDFIEHENNKELVVNYPYNPVSTLLRIFKYMDLGYKLDDIRVGIDKILGRWEDLSLEDKDLLFDSLMNNKSSSS